MPTTCFRPWQVRFSKRYEIGGAAQHNLLPPTLPSRGLHGVAKEEYQCSIRRSARRWGGSILPSPLAFDRDGRAVNRPGKDAVDAIEDFLAGIVLMGRHCQLLPDRDETVYATDECGNWPARAATSVFVPDSVGRPHRVLSRTA